MTVTRLLGTVTAALFICLAGWAQSEAGDLQITEMAVTTKVVKGRPIDSVRRISSASVKTLYCFTRFAGSPDTDTTVTHVWYLNDKQVLEDKMPVKGARWRAYSSKAVEKGVVGEWRCDAQDSEGKVLKSVGFTMH